MSDSPPSTDQTTIGNGNIFSGTGNVRVTNVTIIDEQWESLLVLDQFLVPQDQFEKIKAVFIQPKGYTHIVDILNQRKLLWLIGQSGIGKRTLALFLSLHEPERMTYVIPRFVNWAQVDASEVENANLIFPDTLGAVGFERKNLESELVFLENLIKRENKIIITSPDDIYSEALKTLPRFIEWISKSTKPFILDNDGYSYINKINIFKKTLFYAHDETGIISDEQKRWGLDLIETTEKSEGQQIGASRTKNRALFQKLIKEVWLPIDIDRFVVTSLTTTIHSSDILELLHRDANIDSRIHLWFIGLDDSTRCFILTLSLFVGMETEELWRKYKEIVNELRKLDPNLSIFPLGILRQHASPYVSENGTVDFVNPRVYKAIVNEVAKNYREYFIELIPLLTKWSIPDLPSTITKDERDNRLANTEVTRNAIARMVGEVAKYGLNDIVKILESWATNSFGTIGKTAGIALKETVTDPRSAKEALTLIHEWSIDFSSPVARFHRWTAGSVLWRIASIKSRFDLTNFSLRHLQKLAKDPEKYVVSSAAHAFRMLGRTVPIQDMTASLTQLANEDEVFTRQQVAFAVDEAAREDRDGVYNLLSSWASGQGNTIWTATYILLIGHNISRVERYPRLVNLLTTAPLWFINALHHSLLDEENNRMAWSVLGTLAEENRVELISVLANVIQKRSTDLDSLNSILLSSTNMNISNIPSAIEKEIQIRDKKAQLPVALPAKLQKQIINFTQECSQLAQSGNNIEAITKATEGIQLITEAITKQPNLDAGYLLGTLYHHRAVNLWKVATSSSPKNKEKLKQALDDVNKALSFPANVYQSPETHSHLKDLKQKIQAAISECFIATVVYGDISAPEVIILRQFREAKLRPNRAGRWVINIYQMYSPPLADWIAKHYFTCVLIRGLVLSPIVWIVRRCL